MKLEATWGVGMRTGSETWLKRGGNRGPAARHLHSVGLSFLSQNEKIAPFLFSKLVRPWSHSGWVTSDFVYFFLTEFVSAKAKKKQWET